MCAAGADEFLPVLMHVLAHYYTPRLEAEVKYTLHLLNEKLWSGEGKAIQYTLTLSNKK